MEMLDRMSDNITAVTLSPWGAEEVGLYLEGQKLGYDAARIADIASGRPGFIAELDLPQEQRPIGRT